ncbi:MAG: hypothetical protein PHO33_04125 [Clostridia bacterium]|nr:hypothetical protein [Clostridia bacterium]
MIDNSFKLIKSKTIIDEIIIDSNQSLNTKNFVGDASLSTQIGYLQLNFNIETNYITSIDGAIPCPFVINISEMNFINCTNVILHLTSEKKFNKGTGYNFNFSGKTYYDKHKKVLIIGDLIGNKLVKIGKNAYAVVSNLKNNEYILNSIIIQPIEISKNITIDSSYNYKYNINFETIN